MRVESEMPCLRAAASTNALNVDPAWKPLRVVETSSPRSDRDARRAWLREMTLSSAIRSRTTLRRARESAALLVGSYWLGFLTTPASSADSRSVRRAAGLEK